MRLSHCGLGHLLLSQVDDDVLLAPELELELLSGDVDEAALLALGDRVRLHAVKFIDYSLTRRRSLRVGS